MSHTSELPMVPPTTFERIGQCNRFCGRCCSVARWRQHPQFADQLEAFFIEMGESERGECAQLVWRNGQAVCAIYDERPEICRVFPNHPLSIEILPECTFQFRTHTEGGQP